MYGLSPVYFSVLLFSHTAVFSCTRSMVLTSFICCWLWIYCLFFTFPPFCFVFLLGLLSGASWGNAWSLPSVCVFYPCFSSCVYLVSLLIHHISGLPLCAKCSYQMSCHILFSALCLVTASHILAFYLCYVTVFVSHLFLSYISAITCSPLMEHVFVGTVCKCQMHQFLNGIQLDTSCFFLIVNIYLLTQGIWVP